MSKMQTIETFADLDTPESQIEELIRRNWWSSVPLTAFPASWLLDGEQRLDGRCYANESFNALLVLRKSNLPIEKLGSLLSDSFVLGRFKRIYATDKNAGWPYLSASEALLFRPDSDRYLAKDHTPSDAEAHFAKEGWILISCSGTVGRITIASKRLESFFLTHDLIRLVPGKLPGGYIYAFLSSWIGQALIRKDQYGSAIKHIEPHHVNKIPIPIVVTSLQEAIDEKITKAFHLRDEANALLDETDALLHEATGLPQFDHTLIEYFDPSTTIEDNRFIPSPKSFVLNTSELDDRLDGSYHVPIARTAIKLIHKATYETARLGDIVDRVYVAPRFKRIYVPQEYGTPLLQGGHLPQTTPADLKYISNTQTKNLKQWIVHEGWVLVTCSGTIGRVGLVPSAHDGWAASQHILRIVAKKEVSHPGYIMAFLATPYGQHQLKAKIYGAVVDELTEEDTKAVWIPNAPYDVQKAIGEKVVEAYEKRELANQIEAKAIRQLEMILEGNESEPG